MSRVLDIRFDELGSAWADDQSPSAHSVLTIGTAHQQLGGPTAAHFPVGTDRLVIPDHADFDFGTDDFTIKTDIYFEVIDDSYWVNRGDGASWLVMYRSTGRIWFYAMGSVRVDEAWSPAANTWYEIKVTRVSGEIEIFVDEVSLGSSTTYGDSITGADDIIVGSTVSGGGNPMLGFMKNILVINDGTTVLDMPMDSGSDMPIVSTALFDGTADCWLEAPHSAEFDFGTGEFTLECKVKHISLPEQPEYLSTAKAVTSGVSLTYYDGTLYTYVGGVARTFTWTPALLTWYDISLTRDGANNLRAFVDGQQIGSTIASVTENVDATGTLLIGGGSDSALGEHDGYIKEVRLSDIARYTANYSPSQDLFVDDINTVLLLHLNGVPGDTDDTNGWLADETGTHTVTRNADVVCIFTTDHTERTFKDKSAVGHVAQPIGTVKIDWLSAHGIGSGDFDGDSDALEMASDADWDLGTDNSTMGFWVKFRSFANNGHLISAYSSNGWFFYHHGGDDELVMWNDGAEEGESVIFLLNEWYYVELNNVGGTYTAYVNGLALTAYSTSFDLNNDGEDLHIAAESGGANQSDVLMDLVFIDKGSAAHSANFIPTIPTEPVIGGARRIFLIT